MKNINKLLSVLIAITILFTNISYSKAQNDVKFDKPDDIFYAKKIEEVNLLVNNLENMTENELQQFISNCRRISEDNKKLKSSNFSTENNIAKPMRVYDQIAVAAWIAAANIAKLAGLECAGTLLEKSVQGYNYSETSFYSKGMNGPFAKKIKTTNAYKKLNKSISDSSDFPSSDNLDLHLAINKFNYKPLYTYGQAIHITDTFDFHANQQFGNWLVDRINDFGYLNQQIGLLRKIRVDIIVK
ncbi:hypothetical protein [Helcococcus kunzii]|uniref:hypothetical protein n=1 Tax=Helcococcus kunzii TaxID=40091 RepID=UPI0024ACC5AD|nr:hypothetical protein [Helcococcus kunzii]